MLNRFAPFAGIAAVAVSAVLVSLVLSRDGSTASAPPPPLPNTLALVVAHYDEDLHWLWSLPPLPAPWQPLSLALSEKTAAGAAAARAALSPGGAGAALAGAALPVSQTRDNWGCEAVSYLRYIVQHYDALPSLTAFVQGAPLSSTPALPALLRCADAAWPARAGAAAYAPLSHGFVRNRVVLPPPGAVYDGFAAAARARVAAALPGLPPGARELAALAPLAGQRISFTCCGTFLAGAAALRSYPRAFWAALLDAVEGHRDIPPEYVEREPPTGMLAAAYLEHVWARLFGRPLDEAEPLQLCPRAGGAPWQPGDAPILPAERCPGSPCGAAGGPRVYIRDEQGGSAPIPALPRRTTREEEARRAAELAAAGVQGA